ncbi:IS110 family RNA-guided transposase [Nakamurella leprariae]|uniref:IS110 family transposase n=1 Tax=Nakamurella leprariae TaxID=2803911 RepID=A0A938YKR1_9ACTN|nr:IS110 family transposase [Nakamurella leprariae]MBM9469668.1 IS110 family transposase [Nakamurella leprariae]
MSNGRGLSRGDKRRNARLSQLRRVLPREHAVLAVDLADDKQVFALTDHDSRVLARRTVRCRPWQLGEVIAWGQAAAVAAGFTGVTLACEPTGHRWKVVDELAAAAGVVLVCVQPLLVHRAREAEDFTRDKSDDKDALLIARLATQLHVYLPERADATWSRLRHLGARRAEWITHGGAARQQLRDLLECAWPAALTAAGKPLDSLTWKAAMSVTACDPARVRTLGLAGLTEAVRAELPRWGTHRIHRPILAALHAAASDRQGVSLQRPGALERAAFALADLHHAHTQRTQVEALMVSVLDELDLTGLVTSIPGLSAVSAAAILAETGDLTRFDTGRAVVKHAGLCPRENASGSYTGKTTISGRGRPLLRVAAWRAVWGGLRHNPVLAARHAHLTSRTTNPLSDAQARVAVAGSLLRQLFMVVTTRTTWNADIAAGTRDPRTEVTAPAA